MFVSQNVRSRNAVVESKNLLHELKMNGKGGFSRIKRKLFEYLISMRKTLFSGQ